MPISGMTACLADKRMDMIGGAVTDLASSKVQCDGTIILTPQVGFEFERQDRGPPKSGRSSCVECMVSLIIDWLVCSTEKGERARDDFRLLTCWSINGCDGRAMRAGLARTL